MPNVLVLNMTANLIIGAYQHIGADDVATIRHKYSRLGLYKNCSFRVLQVCDVIFDKYLKLDCKYSRPGVYRGAEWPVTIKQLLRASDGFRATIAHITPRRRRAATGEQISSMGQSVCRIDKRTHKGL